MAIVTYKGSPVSTVGELPTVGSPAPSAMLTGLDLEDHDLSAYKGTWLILNIFPSIDTSICATSVRRFNQEAASLTGTSVLCVSNDLPFAQKRFCGAEGIDRVTVASGFRHVEFAARYGVLMADGPLAGLMARAVVVIDAAGVVRHTELVPDIGREPNYAAALAAL